MKITAQFYNNWTKKWSTMAFNMNIPRPDINDVVAELWADFLEGDYQDIYDPNKGAESTFMYGFARVRLMALRRKTNRLVSMVEIDAGPGASRHGSSSYGPGASRHGSSSYGSNTDTFDIEDTETPRQLETQTTLRSVMKVLESRPVRGSRDMPQIIHDLYNQILTTDSTNFSELARQYDISPTAMSKHMAHIRSLLKEELKLR